MISSVVIGLKVVVASFKIPKLADDPYRSLKDLLQRLPPPFSINMSPKKIVGKKYPLKTALFEFNAVVYLL